MDWKILIAVLGSTILGAILLMGTLFSIVSAHPVEQSRMLTANVKSPGIYVITLPKTERMSSDFSNLVILQNGEKVPFWIEGVSKHWAKIWMKVNKPGNVAFTTSNRRYSGEGAKVFPVFDDFTRLESRKWRVINELPQIKAWERISRIRRCMESTVKDGKLIAENGKPFGKCKLVFEEHLKKIAVVKMKASGNFEIGFEGMKKSVLILTNSFRSKGWKLEFRVNRRVLRRMNVPETRGWFTLEVKPETLKINGKSLEIGKFEPRRFFLSVGTPGRVELDYVYSLNDYKKVVIER